jgi:2-dehydro-3-deoxyphosphogluconate aldolase / (4S)-4-hydroxy-2-oxoglutarate aldolase
VPPVDTDPITAQLAVDRSLVVVRAAAIPDAAELCAALVEGGIRTVELTFTSPDVLPSLRRAAAVPGGAILGAGTVLTADDARAAIDAGARFLVTPGIRPDVARVAIEAGVPVYLGAMTPTEVAMAVDLGSSAVKIFPAGRLGPGYLKDLQGSMRPTPATTLPQAPSPSAAEPAWCHPPQSRQATGPRSPSGPGTSAGRSRSNRANQGA